MISPYYRPQDTITQRLQRLPSTATRRLNGLIAGVRYYLSRYGREDVPAQNFVQDGATYPYMHMVDGQAVEGIPAGATVDLDSVEVYIENAAGLIGANLAMRMTANNQPTSLRLQSGKVAGSSRNVSIVRDVQVGDYVLVNDNVGGDAARVRKISGIIPSATAASVGAIVAGPLNTGTAAVITKAGTYTGVSNNVLVVEITAATSATARTFRVYDTQGMYPIQTYTAVTVETAMATAMGGVTLTIPAAADANALKAGNIYTVALTAAGLDYDNPDGIILDGPAVDTTLATAATDVTVTVFEKSTVQVPAARVTAGPTSVVVAGSLENLNGRVLQDSIIHSQVFVSYRASMAASPTQGPIKVASSEQIIANFGPIDRDNDVAYGLFVGLSGSQGLPIFGLQVGDTSLGAWTTALGKIRSSDLYVYLGAVTGDDSALRASLREHVESMSTPEKRNFRRVYIGVDSPGTYTVLNLQENTLPHMATVTGTGISFTTDVDLVALGVSAGDLVEITKAGAIISLEIAAVLSATEATLVAAPSSNVYPAQPVRVLKADTPENTIDYVVQAAETANSRRTILVWSDSPILQTSEGAITIPAKYIACEVAGLVTALLPQEGVTGVELRSISAAPSMYTRFQPEDLDRASAAGVFVVTQDQDGGAPYIRHQVTTDTDNGILYYEDSVGRSIDAFSYMEKDRFKDFRIRKNITRESLILARDELLSVADTATKTLPDADVGPLIATFYNENGEEGKVTVKQHPLLHDRVFTYVRIAVPLPLNGMDNHIHAVESIISVEI